MGRVGCGSFIAIYLCHSLFLILFCCSVWDPYNGLQSFTNISSVGPLHGIQSFRNGLLQCDLRSCQQTRSMGSPIPSGHVHLLRCGVLCGCLLHCHIHELQCDTYGHLCGLQETLEHLLLLLLPWSWCMQSCFTLIFFSTSHSHSCCAPFFIPSETFYQRVATSISVWLSYVWVYLADGWNTGAAPSFFSQRPPQHNQLNINTLSVNLTHQGHLRIYYDLLIKIIREMPLPKLWCKGDHCQSQQYGCYLTVIMRWRER